MQQRFLPTFQGTLPDCVASSICKNLFKRCQHTLSKKYTLAGKELVIFLIADNLEEWGLDYKTRVQYKCNCLEIIWRKLKCTCTGSSRTSKRLYMMELWVKALLAITVWVLSCRSRLWVLHSWWTLCSPRGKTKNPSLFWDFSSSLCKWALCFSAFHLPLNSTLRMLLMILLVLGVLAMIMVSWVEFRLALRDLHIPPSGCMLA